MRGDKPVEEITALGKKPEERGRSRGKIGREGRRRSKMEGGGGRRRRGEEEEGREKEEEAKSKLSEMSHNVWSNHLSSSLEKSQEIPLSDSPVSLCSNKRLISAFFL